MNNREWKREPDLVAIRHSGCKSGASPENAAAMRVSLEFIDNTALLMTPILWIMGFIEGAA